MKKLLGLGLAGLGLLMACGGSDKPATSSNDIKSMPAYPDPSAAPAKQSTPPAAAKPSDPKTICAEAKPIADKQRSSFFDDDKGFFGELPASANAKSTPYTMADLNALDKKGGNEELLAHAEDVPPAQRSDAWEKVVTHAAVGYMAGLTTGQGADEGFWSSQGMVKRYPFLSKSTEFMTKRNEAAKVSAGHCMEASYGGQHCIESLKEFLKVQGTSKDMGFQFGKVVRLHMNHYVAIPFFKWSFDQSKDNDATWCADEDLRLAVVAGLGLPTEYDNAAGARSIAQDRCWAQVKADATKALLDSPTGSVRDNTCAVMKAKGEL